MTWSRFALLCALLLGLAVTTLLVISPWERWFAAVAPLDHAEYCLARLPFVPPVVRAGCLGTPEATLAWQRLDAAPDAAERFRRVLERGTPAGRMYARAGLYAHHVSIPAALAWRLAHDTTMVYLGSSDVVGEYAPAGALLDSMTLINLAATLRRAPAVPQTCWD